MADKTAKKKPSVRRIMQNSHPQHVKDTLAFIKKTGCLAVDLYAGKEPVVLCSSIPKQEGNVLYLIQDAVEKGYDKEKNGNYYVAKGAIIADNSKFNLREDLTIDDVKPTIQCYFDKPTYGEKDKSRFIQVVNATHLKKFVGHNVDVPEDVQEKVVNILKGTIKNVEVGSNKEGLATYQALSDTAKIPEIDDKKQHLKDIIYMVASSEVYNKKMQKEYHKFKREISKEEQLLLKHYVAGKLRRRLDLGADERNGWHRENAVDRKHAEDLLLKKESLLFDIERRAEGIVAALEDTYFKDMIPEKNKAKDKTKSNDNTNDMSI